MTTDRSVTDLQESIEMGLAKMTENWKKHIEAMAGMPPIYMDTPPILEADPQSALALAAQHRFLTNTGLRYLYPEPLADLPMQVAGVAIDRLEDDVRMSIAGSTFRLDMDVAIEMRTALNRVLDALIAEEMAKDDEPSGDDRV